MQSCLEADRTKSKNRPMQTQSTTLHRYPMAPVIFEIHLVSQRLQSSVWLVLPPRPCVWHAKRHFRCLHWSFTGTLVPHLKGGYGWGKAGNRLTLELRLPKQMNLWKGSECSTLWIFELWSTLELWTFEVSEASKVWNAEFVSPPPPSEREAHHP